MRNYERPVVLVNSELTEGVYAASGDSCYTATAVITQRPETGRENYCIQLNGTHHANHHCNQWQQAVISFNQTVTYQSSQGSIVGSESGTTLTIQYNYHQNASTNIGLGDLYVTSADGLAITGFYITDEGHTFDGDSF
ncbi:MAG: hypothetical protein K5675_02750 [Lachnospiraceae bacterium]|nr:hypothetical protein [Lachnospiraceae bacterium]